MTMAAKRGNVEFATALKSHGISVTSVGLADSPLYGAAYFKQVAMVRWLLAQGANPDLGTNALVELFRQLDADGSSEAKDVKALLSQWLEKPAAKR